MQFSAKIRHHTTKQQYFILWQTKKPGFQAIIRATEMNALQEPKCSRLLFSISALCFVITDSFPKPYAAGSLNDISHRHSLKMGIKRAGSQSATLLSVDYWSCSCSARSALYFSSISPYRRLTKESPEFRAITRHSGLFGGEQGSRTLEHPFRCYTISNRAPSASSDNSPYTAGARCVRLFTFNPRPGSKRRTDLAFPQTYPWTAASGWGWDNGRWSNRRKNRIRTPSQVRE